MKQWVEAEYEKRKLEVEDADIDPYACVGDIVIALYQLELFARHMGQVDGRVSKGRQLDWMEGRVSCVGYALAAEKQDVTSCDDLVFPFFPHRVIFFPQNPHTDLDAHPLLDQPERRLLHLLIPNNQSN
jgi:hypothetical protein